MGEIYRDSINKGIDFDIAGVSPTSAIFRRGGTNTAATVINGVAKVPYAITKLDGQFDIKWTFAVDSSVETRTDTHDVVTPLFTHQQLIEYDDKFVTITQPQAIRLERLVRSVFETLTGQKFGYEFDRVALKGNGRSTIGVPKRLVSANYLGLINSTLEGSYSITNDGWTLTALAMDSWVDALNSSYAAPPIENPYKGGRTFRDGDTFYLEGFYGYTSVPDDINMAAMILAGDYGCDESTWRDRYIANIRSADWRIEFNKNAFHGTGNVVVDQLLSKYTLHNMSVI